MYVSSLERLTATADRNSICLKNCMHMFSGSLIPKNEGPIFFIIMSSNIYIYGRQDPNQTNFHDERFMLAVQKCDFWNQRPPKPINQCYFEKIK